MTYNIRACLGTDGVRSVQRIAAIIQAADPDVVALQEVDFSRIRSDEIDQAERLAELIHAKAIAGPSFSDGTGQYGNAVLSRFPAQLVRHERLPHLAGTEPRSAMWVRIDHPEFEAHIINTHLSFRRRDRPRQIDDLLGHEWLGHEDISGRIVLCGDLNCTPRDRGYRRLAAALRDPQDDGPRATWPTLRPLWRLDHILVPPSIGATGTRVVRTRAARVASDHYPVVADLSLAASSAAEARKSP